MPDKTRSFLATSLYPRPNLCACSCHEQTVFILTTWLLVNLEKLNKLSLRSNHLRYFLDCCSYFLVITLTGKANNNNNNVTKWSLLKKLLIPPKQPGCRGETLVFFPETDSDELLYLSIPDLHSPIPLGIFAPKFHGSERPFVKTSGRVI